MTAYQECWFYQCTKPECGVLGIVNDVVLTLDYPDGNVPCPRCSTPMERIRQALPGEYDPEWHEAAAQRVSMRHKIRVLEPQEWVPYMNPMMYGFPCAYSCPTTNDRRADDGKPAESGTLSAETPEAHAHEPTFLTEGDVAHLLGISVRAVRRLVKDKKLRAIRPTKKKRLFTHALIDEYLLREAGIPSRPGHASHSAPGCDPSRSSLSLEESRALQRDLPQKSNHRKRSLDEIPPLKGSRR